MFDIKLAASIMFDHALLHYGVGKRCSYVFGGSINSCHLFGDNLARSVHFKMQILLDTGLCVASGLKTIDP